jgi:hypothetical protein
MLSEHDNPVKRGRGPPLPRTADGVGPRYATFVEREEVIRVLRAFEAAGLEYVLIGAAALGFHGLVRATEDLDILIRATAENVERLRIALRKAYDGDPHIEEITAADLLGDYPAVRYCPPAGDLYFDVLTRLGNAASFDTVESGIRELDGVRVVVATPAALYHLKRNTVRPIDREDAVQGAPGSTSGTPADIRVQKFRSIEDMNRAQAIREPDFERFLRHCARYRLISPKHFPRGVFKFRTLEDAAQRARDAR